MTTVSQRCERARSWASLRADGELSELESALLDAHLGRCDDCRAFAQASDGIAAALRAASFEQPAPLAHHLPRRRSWRGLQVAAAACLVVAAGVVAAVSTPQQRSVPKPVAMVAAFESPDRIRALRRPLLLDHGRTIPRNRQVPGEPV
jgi:ferric-dicitrate binding protein FerR (iron transport regulator)